MLFGLRFIAAEGSFGTGGKYNMPPGAGRGRGGSGSGGGRGGVSGGGPETEAVAENQVKLIRIVLNQEQDHQDHRQNQRQQDKPDYKVKPIKDKPLKQPLNKQKPIE